MKKSYISIFVFGGLLAVLAVLLQFFEYKYYIGNLNTDVYTSVVATIFTGIGIWLGVNLLKPKKMEQVVAPKPEMQQAKIKALNLNDREFEMLQLIAKGLSNQEIADELYLALPTIKTHISNLYSKLDVRSRTQAIHKAQTLNLI